MKFIAKLAGLGFFVLAATAGMAQHAGGHVAGGSHFAGPPAVGRAAQGSAAGHATVFAHPFIGMRMQRARVPYVGVSPALQNPASRFAPRNAPSALWLTSSRRVASGLWPQADFRRGFDLGAERFRRFPHFPTFFFGGVGQPICSPLLPGYFGAPWFDRQFTCFGTPFFGTDYYPRDFLAPELAYEPWLKSLAESRELQMYPLANGGLTVGDLDMIAAIAARQSADSNPSVQVTTLVLKDGISFGLTDYWVEGGMLHYITTYGRQNAIDLDRIDLDKTVKLNSSRGIPFVLSERPASPAVPPQ
jgi:hypothetical protein